MFCPWAKFLGLLSDWSWKLRVEMRSANVPLCTLIHSLMSPPNGTWWGWVDPPESQRDIIKPRRRDAALAKTTNVHHRYFCFIKGKKKFLSKSIWSSVADIFLHIGNSNTNHFQLKARAHLIIQTLVTILEASDMMGLFIINHFAVPQESRKAANF